jgi:hypothetical protein
MVKDMMLHLNSMINFNINIYFSKLKYNSNFSFDSEEKRDQENLFDKHNHQRKSIAILNYFEILKVSLLCLLKLVKNELFKIMSY